MKGLSLRRVEEVDYGDNSYSETEEPQAPQGSNPKRSNEIEAESDHDDNMMIVPDPRSCGETR